MVAPEDDVTRSELPTKRRPAEVKEPAPEWDLSAEPSLGRPVDVGDVIAEKYDLVREIGRGSMGRIFAATHLLLGTTVALKLLHAHLALDPTQTARFAREARAAASLKSENAARILDVDRLPTGELYMVMEYLEGTSLEKLLAGGRGLPIADAVAYVMQACNALAEAHSRSIIHRDVKPANLFLTTGKFGEPVLKVLDFGLAKSLVSTEGFSSSSLSTAGVALGTPCYMAPEQITGKGAVDGRSDVWAVGATLYELLTGDTAFGGSTVPAVFDKILAGSPKPLHVHRPEIPAPVVAIVERCLIRDATARFQTVRELSEALDASLRVSEAPAFVAAKLTTGRFVHSSAPPALPAHESASSSNDYPSLHPSVCSIPPDPVAPVAPIAGAPLGANLLAADAVALGPEALSEGPSVRQTVLAALTGPALLVVAAAVVAIVMRSPSVSTAGTPATAVAREPVFVTATSGDATRSKAPPEDSKPAPRRK